jgi:hypothetical protein
VHLVAIIPATMQRSPLAGILLSLLILTGAVVFAFGPCLPNGFVNWDDQSEIVENPDFNPVTLKGLEWNWTNTRLTLYMPITYMVWAGVAEIAGREHDGTLSPMAFHALSIGLHLLCSILVFFLILQLWKRIWPALAGAIVFAVHPLQAEPVAWASGMYTVLSSALCFGALIAYVAWALNENRTSNIQRPTSNIEVNAGVPSSLRRWKLDVGRSTFALYWLATFLYLIALLTKAASASLPLVVAVIDLFILGRPIKKIVWPVLFWVALAIPIIWLAKHFQDVSQIAAPSLLGRPVVALDAMGFYLRKIVLPIGLIPDYGRNPSWVMQHQSAVAVSAVTAIVALLLAWFARKNAAWITAGIGLLIVGICPYLGLTTFDFQYVSTVADRYAYFGMFGVAVLAAGAAIRSRTAGIILLVIFCCWAIMTHRQVQRWQDTQTLFDYTLQVNNQSLISHNVFGFLAAKEGRYSEAEAHYKAALKIWPEDATIRFNLGNLYMRSNPELAIEQYEQAVQCMPGFALYHHALATAFARTDHPREAYDQWKTAIVLDPNFLVAHNTLADLLMNGGHPSEAISEYHEALRIDPTNAHAIEQLRRLEHSRAR